MASQNRTGEKPVAENGSAEGSRSIRGSAIRSRILEEAAELFATKGFEGTSFKDIAEALGLTRPALYHYFSSKDEVLATLVEEVSESIAGRVRVFREHSDLPPSEKLRAATRELVSGQTASPQRFRMLDRTEAALPPELGEKHLRARRAVLNEFTMIISEGVRVGEFRAGDERVAALGVIGMANWVAWWFVPGRYSADAICEQLADSAVAMVSRPEHHRPADGSVSASLKLLREDLDHLERMIGR